MPLIRVAMGVDGPIVDLNLWIARSAAHNLIAQRQSVPNSQIIRALLDTGADRTAIHPSALRLIKSLPAGTVEVRRPGSQRFRRVDVHDVRLAFASVRAIQSRVGWVEIESAAIVPANPTVLALVGRDMLAHCRFLYDGLKGELLLVY
jgi:hypothetical protein